MMKFSREEKSRRRARYLILERREDLDVARKRVDGV